MRIHKRKNTKFKIRLSNWDVRRFKKSLRLLHKQPTTSAIKIIIFISSINSTMHLLRTADVYVLTVLFLLNAVKKSECTRTFYFFFFVHSQRSWIATDRGVIMFECNFSRLKWKLQRSCRYAFIYVLLIQSIWFFFYYR